MNINITNEQKKKLIDAMHILMSVGQEVGERFCEENGNEIEEDKLDHMSDVIALALIAFPWSAALNIYTTEGDEEKIKAAWAFAEIMGGEFAEVFQDLIDQESNTAH